MAWFLDQNGLHGDGMATAPRQPAPGTAAAPLKGWSRGDVPGQVTVDPRAGHG